MIDFKDLIMSQINNVETEPDLIELAENLRENNKSLLTYLTDEMYQDIVDLAVKSLKVTFGESFIIENEDDHKAWFEKYYKDLQHTRWDRYIEFLKREKKYPPAVTTAMKENLFRIIDLVGDPNGNNFTKKGLVVGDVQSGKTSNYIGLMNLAMDANYKVIIVLTGTTNELRKQTQIRIEEGVGKNRKNPVGVSALINDNYTKFVDPAYLTTEDDDFNKYARNSMSPSQTSVTNIIVTKKNTKSLEHIYSWLSEYSKKNNNYINFPLLLIDDEADYASVNTSNPDEDPTTINSRIREILQLFTKSSYIGFTATPFANIFIDPDDEHDMVGRNLFPSDYIYILGESAEYVGVQKLFDSNDNKENIVTIYPSEVEIYLPLKHGKEQVFTRLATSMKEAVNTFLLANVIRDLRGNKTSHRTMLFNISRYVDVHQDIKAVVSDYLENIKKEVRLYSKLEYSEAVKFESIAALEETYKEQYRNLRDGWSFKEILNSLNDSIFRIKVAIVNKDNKGVDYLRNEEEGERVIVIGGLSLSRGLTLEGLIVSYFWRNSMTYDTLLQMGRWFGYRAGYEDLTRIYITSEVQNDFSFIAKATRELKEDLKYQSDKNKTPRQFGIKVRSGQTGLMITARNKMKAVEDIVTRVNFNQDIVETLAINTKDEKINENNIKTIKNLVSKNKEKVSMTTKFNGLKDVKKDEIIELLEDYIQVQSSKFDNNLVRNWLLENESHKLNFWDVAFVTGNHKIKFDYGCGLVGNANVRTLIKDNEDGIYKTKKARLGSPTDGAIGLTKKQIEIVKSDFSRRNNDFLSDTEGKSKTIPQNNYFDKALNRKPILLIYSVVPKYDERGRLEESYHPMITLGIPDLGESESKSVKYTVNKYYQGSIEVEGKSDEI